MQNVDKAHLVNDCVMIIEGNINCSNVLIDPIPIISLLLKYRFS